MRMDVQLHEMRGALNRQEQRLATATADAAQTRSELTALQDQLEERRREQHEAEAAATMRVENANTQLIESRAEAEAAVSAVQARLDVAQEQLRAEQRRSAQGHAEKTALQSQLAVLQSSVRGRGGQWLPSVCRLRCRPPLRPYCPHCPLLSSCPAGTARQHPSAHRSRRSSPKIRGDALQQSAWWVGPTSWGQVSEERHERQAMATMQTQREQQRTEYEAALNKRTAQHARRVEEMQQQIAQQIEEHSAAVKCLQQQHQAWQPCALSTDRVRSRPHSRPIDCGRRAAAHISSRRHGDGLYVACNLAPDTKSSSVLPLWSPLPSRPPPRRSRSVRRSSWQS